ncbi:uncharacterized protein LOC143205226 [Rhynchophorus ferrugineus]|uniref:uncharacterized protein LOC143205226 n=1 Tax=Rhynchophorus ferrugineus TaxID=354439 RepID=UPI003FCEC775
MNNLKCRLCLEDSDKYVQIFVEDFPKMIELLSGLKIEPNDGLPTVACLQCHQEVKSAMLTRYQIIHSYKVLLEEYHTNKVEEKKTEVLPIKEEDDNHSTISTVLQENTQLSNQVASNNISIDKSENEHSNSSERCDNPDDKILLRNSEDAVNDDGSNTSDQQQFKRLIKKIHSKDRPNVKFTRKSKTFKNIKPQDKIQFKKKCSSNSKGTDAFNIIKPEHVEFLRTLGKKDRASCPICSKEMYGMNMKNHLITHNYDPVICSICGKASKNAQALQDHVNYYHKTTPDRFVCDKCGRGFRVKCALDKHEKKEHGNGEKDFECTVCGKKFFEKTHLKNHVDITHNKIRPFKCEHCGKDFGRRTQFVTHQLVHTKENRYHCQVCGKGFKIKQTMQTHLKGVHGIEEQKTIFCKLCEKGFSSPQGLRAHINSRVHGLEKCKHCSEYITLEYKQVHLRDTHRIESDDT